MSPAPVLTWIVCTGSWTTAVETCSRVANACTTVAVPRPRMLRLISTVTIRTGQIQGGRPPGTAPAAECVGRGVVSILISGLLALAVTEPAQHREHAAVVLGGHRQVEFGENA